MDTFIQEVTHSFKRLAQPYRLLVWCTFGILLANQALNLGREIGQMAYCLTH
ncbi:hypothetical protein G4G28_17735 [Massilia sp. Dwa41.01b]|uniref:hypothetical protein n=1 Tax=unclassified Massilia TaxID=2609279 RepID=UPI0016022651|nr:MULTISPECIES: hypothetical protein [unclassified Massilia]QNA89872.1 hypothetical protein G4G28_17735 [Massilia sp. Dwa41.01b]QNB00760.1 hypothetical protein G4G31_21295 [Massilia sp. Se16.2.3]